MRRSVANSVRKAKNDWFQRKAQEVEDKVMQGVGPWKDILGIFKGGGLVSCLPDPKRLEILMVSFVLLQQTACGDRNNISVLF